MKRNRRVVLLCMVLTLVFSLLLHAAALDIYTPSEEELKRMDQWEALFGVTLTVDDMLNSVGSDFTAYYANTLGQTNAYAKALLDKSNSTYSKLKELTNALNYLIAEQNNPANHERYGHYTVAFTNNLRNANDRWSCDTIRCYVWNSAGELTSWPGDTMIGGYLDEFGNPVYYTYVDRQFDHIIFSCGSGAQTIDLDLNDSSTAFGLTAQTDSGGKYMPQSWKLKAPNYKSYGVYEIATVEPHTYYGEDPTVEDPSVEPIPTPTTPPTEPETSPPTEPATAPTQDWLNHYWDACHPDSMTYVEVTYSSKVSPLENELYDKIIEADSLLAPGNTLSQNHRIKLTKVRNRAAFHYNLCVHNAMYYNFTIPEEDQAAIDALQHAIDDDMALDDLADYFTHWDVVEDPDTPPAPADPTESTVLAADPSESYLVGDADGDGEVTVLDATRVQRILARMELQFAALAQRCGDVNDNGLDILDATAIQRFVARLDTAPNINQRRMIT